MTHLFGQLVSTVSDALEINKATLSGAIDIVATKDHDGVFATTPFHIRFGKIQVLRPRHKKVTVHVNGQRVSLPMQLGKAGEAFFVLPPLDDGGGDGGFCNDGERKGQKEGVGELDYEEEGEGLGERTPPIRARTASATLPFRRGRGQGGDESLYLDSTISGSGLHDNNETKQVKGLRQSNSVDFKEEQQQPESSSYYSDSIDGASPSSLPTTLPSTGATGKTGAKTREGKGMDGAVPASASPQSPPDSGGARGAREGGGKVAFVPLSLSDEIGNTPSSALDVAAEGCDSPIPASHRPLSSSTFPQPLNAEKGLSPNGGGGDGASAMSEMVKDTHRRRRRRASSSSHYWQWGWGSLPSLIGGRGGGKASTVQGGGNAGSEGKATSMSDDDTTNGKQTRPATEGEGEEFPGDEVGRLRRSPHDDYKGYSPRSMPSPSSPSRRPGAIDSERQLGVDAASPSSHRSHGPFHYHQHHSGKEDGEEEEKDVEMGHGVGTAGGEDDSASYQGVDGGDNFQHRANEEERVGGGGEGEEEEAAVAEAAAAGGSSGGWSIFRMISHITGASSSSRQAADIDNKKDGEGGGGGVGGGAVDGGAEQDEGEGARRLQRSGKSAKNGNRRRRRRRRGSGSSMSRAMLHEALFEHGYLSVPVVQPRQPSPPYQHTQAPPSPDSEKPQAAASCSLSTVRDDSGDVQGASDEGHGKVKEGEEEKEEAAEVRGESKDMSSSSAPGNDNYGLDHRDKSLAAAATGSNSSARDISETAPPSSPSARSLFPPPPPTVGLKLPFGVAYVHKARYIQYLQETYNLRVRDDNDSELLDDEAEKKTVGGEKEEEEEEEEKETTPSRNDAGAAGKKAAVVTGVPTTTTTTTITTATSTESSTLPPLHHQLQRQKKDKSSPPSRLPAGINGGGAARVVQHHFPSLSLDEEEQRTKLSAAAAIVVVSTRLEFALIHRSDNKQQLGGCIESKEKEKEEGPAKKSGGEGGGGGEEEEEMEERSVGESASNGDSTKAEGEKQLENQVQNESGAQGGGGGDGGDNGDDDDDDGDGSASALLTSLFESSPQKFSLQEVLERPDLLLDPNLYVREVRIEQKRRPSSPCDDNDDDIDHDDVDEKETAGVPRMARYLIRDLLRRTLLAGGGGGPSSSNSSTHHQDGSDGRWIDRVIRKGGGKGTNKHDHRYSGSHRLLPRDDDPYHPYYPEEGGEEEEDHHHRRHLYGDERRRRRRFRRFRRRRRRLGEWEDGREAHDSNSPDFWRGGDAYRAVESNTAEKHRNHVAAAYAAAAHHQHPPRSFHRSEGGAGVEGAGEKCRRVDGGGGGGGGDKKKKKKKRSRTRSSGTDDNPNTSSQVFLDPNSHRERQMIDELIGRAGKGGVGGAGEGRGTTSSTSNHGPAAAGATSASSSSSLSPLSPLPPPSSTHDATSPKEEEEEARNDAKKGPPPPLQISAGVIGGSVVGSSPAAPATISTRMTSTTRRGGGASSSHKHHTPLRKSLRPSQKMMQEIGPLLRSGQNRLDFSVTSRLQGTQTLTCALYLWPPDSKIVVSDIDGTITRSDILGNLFPVVGMDWSHPGIAQLLTKIDRNGYRVMYLTSRAIGQANLTRAYIKALRQTGGASLPHGPLIMSPDRLVKSLKREVIYRRPQEFKILALRDIRRLFAMTVQPFAAGFGNRISDLVAYLAVGMPAERIFIINKNSEIKQSGNRSYQQSYPSLLSMADDMFPPSEAKSVLFVDSKEANKEMQARTNTTQMPRSSGEQPRCGVEASRNEKIGSTTRNHGEGGKNEGTGRHGGKAKEGDKTTSKNDAAAMVASGSNRSSNHATTSRLVQQPPKRFDELSFWSTPLPDVNDLLSSGSENKEEGLDGDKKERGDRSSGEVDKNSSNNCSSNKKDTCDDEYTVSGNATTLPIQDGDNPPLPSGDHLPSSREVIDLDNKDTLQNNAVVSKGIISENLPPV